MNATTTFSAQGIVDMFLHAVFVDVPLQASRIIWDFVITFLSENWLIIGIGLISILFILTISALLGQWGALGKFLYNLLYISILFVVGLICGPEVFVSNWFGFLTAVILYPVCYKVVGWILETTGLKT